MVKLYYTPTSCGASSFIIAYIAKLDFECEAVDLLTHKTESGIDFYSINPKGNVPTLVLDNGIILNENISCLEYILDLAIKNNIILGPKNETDDRYVLRQLLSFIASELHATIGLFFNPKIKSDSYVQNILLKIFDNKMKYLQKYIINNKNFIFGDYFSIADSYLHIVLSWTYYVGIDLKNYEDAYRYYNYICELKDVKDAKKRMAYMPSKIV